LRVFRVRFLEQPQNVAGLLVAVSLAGISLVFLGNLLTSEPELPVKDLLFRYANASLVMQDGDPYLRTLMRMISASESNDRQPYSLIYGGGRAKNLEKHPNVCANIKAGPNTGNCSTAAGRYQMLNTTWAEKARRYKAEERGWPWDRHYSFSPLQQDLVMYKWLNDPKAWGMDLAAELRKGNVEVVRKRLSGTWTSLGYGIENNAVTPQLASLYQKMLKEELAKKSN
jgi:muramidase (phage lysozyme)